MYVTLLIDLTWLLIICISVADSDPEDWKKRLDAPKLICLKFNFMFSQKVMLSLSIPSTVQGSIHFIKFKLKAEVNWELLNKDMLPSGVKLYMVSDLFETASVTNIKTNGNWLGDHGV